MLHSFPQANLPWLVKALLLVFAASGFFAETTIAEPLAVATLTCNVASGWGFVFGSDREIRCELRKNDGETERYRGSLSTTAGETPTVSGPISFAVVAPSSSQGAVGELEGAYTPDLSSSIEASQNALFRGGRFGAYTLQPANPAVARTVGASTGVHFNLQYVPGSYFAGHASREETQVSAWEGIKPFPLPASARVPIPQQYLVKDSHTTLGAVNDKLIRALQVGGYSDKSYLSVVGGGFTLLTRLERIKSDGRPETTDRFNVATSLHTNVFDLASLVKALLTADPGYYRILAFLVTPRSVTQSADTLDSATLTDWFDEGGDRLPPAIAARTYDLNAGYHCTALVYEFQKVASQENATLLEPSPI